MKPFPPYEHTDNIITGLLYQIQITSYGISYTTFQELLNFAIKRFSSIFNRAKQILDFSERFPCFSWKRNQKAFLCHKTYIFFLFFLWNFWTINILKSLLVTKNPQTIAVFCNSECFTMIVCFASIFSFSPRIFSSFRKKLTLNYK